MIDTSTTLVRVVEQLTKITNSLEQMAAASSKQADYKSQADKYQEDFRKKQKKPLADQDDQASKKGFLKSLGEKIFGLTAPSTLNSNEKQRLTNIAKCFNAVMRVDAIGKSIDRLRESNEEALEQHKRESLFSRLIPKATKTEEKKESKGSMLGSMLKWGLIAAALKLLWDLATAPLNALSGLWEFLSKWSLVGLIKLIKFKIKTFFNTIIYPLKLLYKILGGDSIDNAIKALTGKIGEWIGKFKNFMFETFEKIGEKISKKLGEWIGKFKNFMFEAFEKIGEKSSTKVGEWIGKFKDFMFDAFKGMGERVSKILGSAQKFLLDKFPRLASNLTSIKSVVSESFDSIIRWVKTPFEKLSTKIGEFFSRKVAAAATKLEGSTIGRIIKSAFQKIAGKLGIKGMAKVPGIGTLISFYFAYNRYKQGDNVGAFIEMISGLVGMINFAAPGVGFALQMGCDMIIMWRDMTGRTAADIKKNGPANNWFTKMIDGFGKWASEKLYDWPYIGSLVRSIEHFEAGKWKEGFISLANAIPLVGGMLEMFFDIKETESQAGRGTGNFSNVLKGAWQWTKDLIRDIPVIGDIIKAFELFLDGKFSDGLSELGLGSIIDAIKNFKFEMPSFSSASELLNGAVTWLKDSILNLSWVSNTIKAFEQFKNGNFLDGLSELGLGGVINAIKNFKMEMPSFGDVGDLLTKALQSLRDAIFDFPVIRNIIKSIEYAKSGQWSKAALELVPSGVASWFTKFTGNKAATEQQRVVPSASKVNEGSNQIKIEQSLSNKNVPQTQKFEKTYNNDKLSAQPQKLKLDGITDLQQSISSGSKQEVELLAEQRTIMKNTNNLLMMILNTNAMSLSGTNAPPQPLPNTFADQSGVPTSITRGTYGEGKNIMSMGIQG